MGVASMHFLKPPLSGGALIQQMPRLAAFLGARRIGRRGFFDSPGHQVDHKPGGPVCLFKALTKGVGQCEF